MTRYSYRRKLTGKELGPALAIGAGLGLGVAVVTTYVAQIFFRRTPLGPEKAAPPRHELTQIRIEPDAPRQSRDRT